MNYKISIIEFSYITFQDVFTSRFTKLCIIENINEREKYEINSHYDVIY